MAKTERYTARVVPENILSLAQMQQKGPRRRQAEERKKAWAAVHEEATQVKRTGNRDEKIILPTGARLSSERASFLATLPLSEPSLDIGRVAREDEYIDLSEMFMEPLTLIRDTAHEYGVETPIPDQLLSLLHLRSRRRFFDTIMYRHDVHEMIRSMILGSEIPESVAIPVGKNVFINTTDARNNAHRPSELDNVLLNVGLEGVLHALEARELWIPRNKRLEQHGIAYSKRTGIIEWGEPVVKKGRTVAADDDVTEGMRVINEQVIGKWQQQILGDRAQPLVDPIGEIDGVIDTVGMPYFVRALCTQEGLATLRAEVDSAYGEGALRSLATKHGTTRAMLNHIFE